MGRRVAAHINAGIDGTEHRKEDGDEAWVLKNPRQAALRLMSSIPLARVSRTREEDRGGATGAGAECAAA
jgi:hypothetical protein